MKRRVKNLLTCMMTAVLIISNSVTALAGQWRQDESGWWYQEDDGSFPKSCWKDVGGKQFYFNEDGYMLANTVTPDGYVIGGNGEQVKNNINLWDIPYESEKAWQYYQEWDKLYEQKSGDAQWTSTVSALVSEVLDEIDVEKGIDSQALQEKIDALKRMDGSDYFNTENPIVRFEVLEYEILRISIIKYASDEKRGAETSDKQLMIDSLVGIKSALERLMDKLTDISNYTIKVLEYHE